MNTYRQRNNSNAENISRHAKHNSTERSKNRENHVEPSIPLHAHFETHPTIPGPVPHANLLFTAPEVPFTRKNTIFRANPNIIQMKSMI